MPKNWRAAWRRPKGHRGASGAGNRLGRYVISDSQGRSSYNFFGIKADERWAGSRVEVPTQEFRGGAMLKKRPLSLLCKP